MKIKDILVIIEQNEDYKKRIEAYKYFPETRNMAQVLEHNYKKWLELDIKDYISECETNDHIADVSKKVDLGFWNKDGEYIEDIHEIDLSKE